MRRSIGKQCNCSSRGKELIRYGARRTTRAREFFARCKVAILYFDIPYRTSYIMIYLCVCMCVHARAFVYIYIYNYIYIYIYIYIYTHNYIYIYIYIYTSCVVCMRVYRCECLDDTRMNENNKRLSAVVAIKQNLFLSSIIPKLTSF